MECCFKCGISEENALLFDAVGEEGVVNVCRKCSFDENLPIVKKRTKNYPLIKQRVEQKIPFKRKSGGEVYKRLLKISGINSEEKIENKPKSPELEKQENDLKRIVEENFNKTAQENQDSKINLVDNFNWIIMRARRKRHMMRQQLAEKISEPELAIKSLENGIYPINKRIIKKIEDYLGIKLLKVNDSNQTRDNEKKISFDLTTNNEDLKISDLQETENNLDDHKNN